MANERIKYNSLPSNFVDGRILSAEDLNKIIRMTVAGINSNKADIDKVLTGKYNSYVFYNKASLTTNVGQDGDYAFIFHGENISGDDRDTLKLYRKHYSQWRDYGEFNLMELYNKMSGIEAAESTYVGSEMPNDPTKTVWLKVLGEGSEVMMETQDIQLKFRKFEFED